MLKKLLDGVVYVKVSRNKFRIRHVVDKKETTITALEPFTTTRLLVGEFSVAEKYLRDGIRIVHEGRWFPARRKLPDRGM